MKVRSLEDLATNFAAEWPALRKARHSSGVELKRIEDACKSLVVPDTSLVVFGSLARQEFTSDSDLDWTLLVDGFTVPEHLTVAQRIASELAHKGPGRTGTFGNLASSHNLIHYIGGEDDSNTNTTRRVLLLLESRSVGVSEAYDRVRNNLLKRYLGEDLGLWRESTAVRFPHFLMNDFARYWRTMAVDFADKQHDRSYEGFALRNIKLRMSRKLIYISGLLACFRCHLDFPDEAVRKDFFSKDNLLQVVQLLRTYLDKAPLDLAAETLFNFVNKRASVKELFDAYDQFLGILSDHAKRERLANLKPHELATDAIYKEAREVSHAFREAVREIFLTADNPVGQLTIDYGVF
jgi:predicted nucleotidyltransferase